MGRIDLYSDDITVYTQTGNMNFAHNEYVEIYFSKDKINLIPIEYDNLVKNLNDNIKSMQHLQNYKTLKYVQIGIAGIGLGIVVAGLLKFDKEDGLTSSAKSTIFTGAIIMNLAWIPSFMKSGEISKAIDEYNSNVH